jgi:hypothetical protein
MTQPVQMKRPEGEAAQFYEEALRLEREAGEVVMHRLVPNLEEAERLRGLAKEAWAKYREASR